jgi:hypothetical protein
MLVFSDINTDDQCVLCDLRDFAILVIIHGESSLVS